MADITDFYTRERANEGFKLPLSLPDGSETEHWLLVCGVDSDAARDARVELNREILNSSDRDQNKQVEVYENSHSKMLARIVKNWSFDEPCTEDAVLNLFKEAPQIAEAVDSYSTNRRLLFKKK